MREQAENDQNTEAKGPDAEGAHQLVAAVVLAQRLDRLEFDDDQHDDGEGHANDDVVDADPEAGHAEAEQEEMEEVDVEDVVADLTAEEHLQAKCGVLAVVLV